MYMAVSVERFAGEDTLLGYLAVVRRCLLARSLESSTPPLLAHFTDEADLGELLAAAFPIERGWRLACVQLCPKAEEGARRRRVQAGGASSARTCYMHTVCASGH